MRWFSLALKLISLISAVLSFVERNQLIAQVRREERARQLDTVVKDLAEAAKIRKEYDKLTEQQVEELFDKRGWWREE